MLPALRDAYHRLLVPGAPTVPQGGRIFVVPIAAPALRRYQSADGSHAGGVLLPVRLCELMATDNEARYLATPMDTGLGFDFGTHPSAFARAVNAHVSVQISAAEATVDAIGVWWDLDLGDGRACYSTSPAAQSVQGFQNHWSPCVTILAESFVVTAGTTMHMQVCCDGHTDLKVHTCSLNLSCLVVWYVSESTTK